MPIAPCWPLTGTLPAPLVLVRDLRNCSVALAPDDQVAAKLDGLDVRQFKRALLVGGELEALLGAANGGVDAANERDADLRAERHTVEVDADVAVTIGDVPGGVVKNFTQCTSSHGDVRRGYVDMYTIH